MTEIRTKRDAKMASVHELANAYREMTENGDYVKRNLVISEALNRGISKEQLKEIR